MIAGQALGRRFGATWAARGIDVDVPGGCVLALLGPNGSGKSTTLGLLGGFLRPTEGTIESRGRCGALVQDAPLPSDRAVGRTLRRHARLLGLTPDAGIAALARFGVDDLAGRRPDTLSHGQRKRAALALAFLGDPDVLLLDEPTGGLDPVEAERVLGAIRDARERGAAVVAATNRVDEIGPVADRVLILAGGAPVLQGPLPDALGGRDLRAAFLAAVS